ncbi:formin-binding protein 4-like [Adelges cooleyi]|uniref:formin-binding protein 4-like n=1 Tax=Adelges cooleyi TaxID=133065 RepID=UPI00218044FC|nr:formin-binding protein 4-like [Adelges cooleyi]
MDRRKIILDMTQSIENEPNGVQIHNTSINENGLMNTFQDNDSDHIWQECYDDVSGFIYYWNTQTNKVTWEKPEYYAAHTVNNEDNLNGTTNSRKRLSSEALPVLDPTSCKSAKKPKQESKKLSALVDYGSDSSDDEKEDELVQKSTILKRLQQKAEMFKQKEKEISCIKITENVIESKSPTDIIDIIGTEIPPDNIINESETKKSLENKSSGDIFDILNSEVPPDYVDQISTSPKSTSPDLKTTNKQSIKLLESNISSLTNLNNEPKLEAKENTIKPFSLIANYGEDNEQDDGTNSLNEKKLLYSHDPCANIKTGFGYSAPTKPNNGGSISFVKGETINLPSSPKFVKTNSLAKQSTILCDLNIDKNHIQELSLLISSKLHFLSDCENNTKLSTVQIMTVKIDTLMEAWKENALNDDYFSKWLDEMAIELRTLEKSVVPDGWSCQWDKTNTRYYYQNIADGHTQWHYPVEETEITQSSTGAAKDCTPPPTNCSEPDTSHPEPEDMDIEDDSHKEGTEIIVPPVPGDELSYELNSFYADIAQFESKPPSQPETIVQTPDVEIVPRAKITSNPVVSVEEDKEVIKPKKKKKVGKLDVGLGLKHKHVSSLVQKWQQIQNEIK